MTNQVIYVFKQFLNSEIRDGSNLKTFMGMRKKIDNFAFYRRRQNEFLF